MSAHDAAHFSHYVNTHEQWMGRLRGEGFIEHDSLTFSSEFAGFVQLSGQIACRGNIVITVEKDLRVLRDGDPDDPLVQTCRYNYNASVQGYGTIMRFDNAGHHGFVDRHHRHDYDWRSSVELPGSPRHVGAAAWPTLGQFIRLVAEWYWTNSSALPEPESIATISSIYRRRIGIDTGAPLDEMLAE